MIRCHLAQMSNFGGVSQAATLISPHLCERIGKFLPTLARVDQNGVPVTAVRPHLHCSAVSSARSCWCCTGWAVAGVRWKHGTSISGSVIAET